MEAAGASDFDLVAAIGVVFKLCFEMNLKTAGAKSVIENRKDNAAIWRRGVYIVGGIWPVAGLATGGHWRPIQGMQLGMGICGALPCANSN